MCMCSFIAFRCTMDSCDDEISIYHPFDTNAVQLLLCGECKRVLVCARCAVFRQLYVPNTSFVALCGECAHASHECDCQESIRSEMSTIRLIYRNRNVNLHKLVLQKRWRTLQLMFALGHRPTHKLTATAAARGDFHMIRLLVENGPVPCHARVGAAVVEGEAFGNINTDRCQEILRYLHSCGSGLDRSACRMAVIHGTLDTLKFLIEQCDLCVRSDLVAIALRRCDIDMCEYLYFERHAQCPNNMNWIENYPKNVHLLQIKTPPLVYVSEECFFASVENSLVDFVYFLNRVYSYWKKDVYINPAGDNIK